MRDEALVRPPRVEIGDRDEMDARGAPRLREEHRAELARPISATRSGCSPPRAAATGDEGSLARTRTGSTTAGASPPLRAGIAAGGALRNAAAPPPRPPAARADASDARGRPVWTSRRSLSRRALRDGGLAAVQLQYPLGDRQPEARAR